MQKIRFIKVLGSHLIRTNKNVMKKLVGLLLLLALSTSCVAVREYDKVYLNDEEMLLGFKSSERFETTFQIYREAAAGANGGKSGGGCGCN